MKHSQSSIFNNSEKSNNNLLKTGFSVLNHNTSTSRKFNNSITAVKFPKILFKTRNKKLYIQKQKNKTQYNDDTVYSNSQLKKSFNSSFNILHLDTKNDKTNKIAKYLRYNKNKSIKNKELENEGINLTLLYNNYQNIKNVANNFYNYYDSIFPLKLKMTDYRKNLSCDYEKDNKNVIDMFTTRFKQKNDSILNVVRNKDGYYIKGLKYKKYYFYPHKKMNILAFHQNIMNYNIKQIKQRNILENLRKKRNEEKKIMNQRTAYLNDNDNFLKENIFSRNRKRHWTKNYVIRKKMKQKIEEIVDDEIHNVLHSLKLK